MSFFKDLNVTYWTNTLYNSGDENIDVNMEISFNVPLIDIAKNYVCAIERMEISGNAIPLYDVDEDGSSVNYIDAQGNTMLRNYIYLHFNQDLDNPTHTYILYGRFYSLQDIITYLNQQKLLVVSNTQDNVGRFTLDADGCIVYQCDTNGVNERFIGNNCIQFASETLASIFGLPTSNTIGNAWYTTYSQYDATETYYKFKTKYSRIDAGNIPSSIQLSSNLPFESDQVNTAKSNIATDFALAISSTNSTSYNYNNIDTRGYVNTISGFSWSFNNGGMIVYNPNERRWLNFSSPTPITQIRLWILYVNNDGISTQVVLPKGCKFSIKMGFYLIEK